MRFYFLFLFLGFISCKPKECKEMSEIIDVFNCHYTHSGTDCYVLTANHMWYSGGSPQIGNQICTDNFSRD